MRTLRIFVRIVGLVTTIFPIAPIVEALRNDAKFDVMIWLLVAIAVDLVFSSIDSLLYDLELGDEG